MDNVTHTLAGLLTAELVSSLATRRDGTRPPWRLAALVTSAIAQNLPDIDFVLVPLTGGKLGNLVQHRGYTHTLLAVLPLALLALAPAFVALRARGRDIGARGWRALAGLAIAGICIHMAMDGTNDYGVHPFWPADPRWFYGDAIFIVEPLLWACAIPTLMMTVETRSRASGWARCWARW